MAIKYFRFRTYLDLCFCKFYLPTEPPNYIVQIAMQATDENRAILLWCNQNNCPWVLALIHIPDL